MHRPWIGPSLRLHLPVARYSLTACTHIAHRTTDVCLTFNHLFYTIGPTLLGCDTRPHLHVSWVVPSSLARNGD
ncbi:hypothetical protein IQ06DRAFT_74140 [Phaeosphaeriaceae sp. SRC1lsM3a]|nr:hypothetical protein IQ06DRAFT_74140 [Stagonospora sp. SRC1lsM3a]